MTELFIYDASEHNRTGDFIPLDKDSVLIGFREALKQLNPPIPFLIRSIFGDYDEVFSGKFGELNPKTPFLVRRVFGKKDIENPSTLYIGSIGIVPKNTFQNRNLSDLLRTLLINGNDRDIDRKISPFYYEEELIAEEKIKYSDLLWANEATDHTRAQPYRYPDDEGIPLDKLNNLSMIINPSLYILDNKGSMYYQPDISLRIQALLGIIISDTNPKRPQLQPMRFNLTPENLDDVVKRLTEAGYFTAV